MNVDSLTPVEKRGQHWYKREDLLVVNGVCGSKVRVVTKMIDYAINSGYSQFVTCGSRDSRQCEVVAKVCEWLGVQSHVFMPSGRDTDVILSIENTKGAQIHRTKVGYNNVLMSQSKAFANDNKYIYLPFGLDCKETIDINKLQVVNVPKYVKRIVVPCGGGMNMIAVIKGLEYYGRTDVSVLGVVVGADPQKTIDKYIQNTLFDSTAVKWSLVQHPSSYSQNAEVTQIDGLELDEIYEAKCIQFMRDGDMLWIVGKKL